jgi:hypothetical protein
MLDTHDTYYVLVQCNECQNSDCCGNGTKSKRFRTMDPKVLNQVERSIRDQLPFAYKTVSRNGFSNHVLNEFKSLVLSGTLTCLCVYQRVLSERHTLEIA